MIRVGATNVRPTIRSPRYPPIRPTASRTTATTTTNRPMAKNIWPNFSVYDMRRHPFRGETTSRWADLMSRQVRPPAFIRSSGLRPGGLDLVDGVLRALAGDPGRRLLPEGVRPHGRRHLVRTVEAE